MSTIIDLFAGPGGWDEGLRMTGRTDVLGIEIDPVACATATANGHDRLRADITELEPRDVVSGKLEGLTASPVCDGFSRAGRGAGRMDLGRLAERVADLAAGYDPRGRLHLTLADERSDLALEPLRWALQLRPQWLAWEQVPDVLPLWDLCADVLRGKGYKVWTGIVNAEEFGVPQTRRRAALLASRRAFTPPAPTHSKYHVRTPGRLDAGRLPWVTIAESLPGLVDELGPDWVYMPTTMPNAAIRRLDQPAPTMAFGNDHRSAAFMPAGSTRHDLRAVKADGTVRRLAPAEAAALQTFPAGYQWHGRRGIDVWRQIGDAVPPLLAAHLLASLGVGRLAEGIAA